MQIDYLDLVNLVRNNERENFSQSKCSHCECSNPTEKIFKKQRNYKVHKISPFNSQNSNNKRNERNSQKPNTCFICGLEDHFIAKFPKPDTLEKKLHWNRGNYKTLLYRLKIKIKFRKTVQMKTIHRIYTLL